MFASDCNAVFRQVLLGGWVESLVQQAGKSEDILPNFGNQDRGARQLKINQSANAGEIEAQTRIALGNLKATHLSSAVRRSMAPMP